MATYSFQDVVASLVGPGGEIDLGYGAAVAEEGITISFNQDRNVQRIGADGEGMNTLRANKSGTVTVRLLKTSPVNQQLTNLYNAQSQSSALWGQNVITVRNTSSGDIGAARECAFVKFPDITYAQDGDTYEWQFHSVKIDPTLGTY